MKNTKITVTFDLAVKGTCYDATTFTDDRGNTTPKRGKDFDSPVNSGMKISWHGVLANANSANDFIDLLAVAKKVPKQISLLERDYYLGRNGDIKGRVRLSGDKIIANARGNEANHFKNAKGEIEIIEEYMISFLVGYEVDGDMNYKMCTIDPKIRML